jgi:hypothetical protein
LASVGQLCIRIAKRSYRSDRGRRPEAPAAVCVERSKV